jgi:CRISPR/Cas system CSM-associated protein Csm3 (group 7 of RAMP superfamily)
LYCTLHGDDEGATDKLFGFQRADEGEASRLHVSWGAIQDSTGQPVEGLLLGKDGEQRLADPVLKALMEGVARETRDRVRIGHRGAAADTGKFDRVVLPAGHRFSAELSLWSDQADDPDWREVLGLLVHPLFRLGGGTRAGLGRIKVVQVHHGAWSLGEKLGRKQYADLPRGLGDLTGLEPFAPPAPELAHLVCAKLVLEPRGFWRIGEGEGSQDHKMDDQGKPADLLPKLESRWDWEARKPKAAELLIPGSSLKGLLAHRVAFHANRRAGHWAHKVLDEHPDYDKSLHCDEVKTLFGFARDDREAADAQRVSSREERGRAGRVFIDDGYLNLRSDELKLMMHNAIDRFTGGVREHMLFSEELVWKGAVELDLMIDTRGVSSAARLALRDALADLCEGRVAIGGGAGKGHGFCDGSLTWSDGGAWIEASDTDHGKQQQEAA